MSYKYFPHTPEDVSSMLHTCGVKSLDDLYSDIPEQLTLKREYNLPSEMSEIEVRKFFDRLGSHNKQLN